MHPSTALARVLIDELVRCGVREAVLCPGSRSAPLAFALHAADAAGRLRLHVRIDERTAGFLALGLAKAGGPPAVVVTTSGTATANLHPAVVEARHAHVPLLLLTADRPPALRGTGANQTTDQVNLYGTSAVWAVDVAVPERRPGQVAYWRSLAARAVLESRTGPVHLNLSLADPLVPDGDEEWVEPLAPRDGPWLVASTGLPGGSPAGQPQPGPQVEDDLPPRTVLVLGDAAPTQVEPALRLAAERGWPVVAEPSASAGGGTGLLRVPELVLAAPGWLAAHRPDRVLVVGRPTLSRAVGALIAGAPTDVVAVHGSFTDPSRTARRVLPAVPIPAAGRVDPSWLPTWLAAGAAAHAAAADVLAGSGLSEPVVAAEVLRAAVGDGGLLVVGSSKPVRDLFLADPAPGARVLANRGAAGIDGTVSTAVGAVLAHGRPAYALLGDLTFLHDANGLVIGPAEPRPDLTIVVVDNDGGGIFSLLEQGGPEHAAVFERVFGTPHGVDLERLCAATGTAYVRAETVDGLRRALVGLGLRVVHVRTRRDEAAALDRRLREAAAAALLRRSRADGSGLTVQG